MAIKWGWFRKKSGGWEKRRYIVDEEIPEDGPQDKDEFWCGSTGGARTLTQAEQDAMFIQTGEVFSTLRDAEVWNKAHGRRIAEQDDTKRITQHEDYPDTVTKEQAGAGIALAKNILTKNPEHVKHARIGGVHAVRAKAEGRN